MELLTQVMEAGKPILGICRGIQLINVALGGDIYQDIPSQTESLFPIAQSPPFSYAYPSHHVSVAEGSLLSGITGDASFIEVNSMHHQAVRTTAPGLIPCGFAPDGLIEALEKPDYPFLLGVQWHPEYLWKTHGEAAEIFRQFVKACRK